MIYRIGPDFVTVIFTYVRVLHENHKRSHEVCRGVQGG